jgi:hypothetical protein
MKISNKKETKIILENWRKFINEREIIQPVAFSSNFSGQISNEDIEDLKSQNYPAYLMILPTINSTDLSKIYNYGYGSKNIYKKSESNYNLIKNKIISLYNRNFTAEELGINDEEELEDYHGGLYKDGQMPIIPDSFPANEEMIDSLEKSFEKAKEYMTNIKDGPFIINFTSNVSDEEAQESGGLFSISKMKPHISKSFVAWLLKHDFHHTLEKYIFDNSNQAHEFERKCIGVRFFSMPGLRRSRADSDNYASVTGYLFGKTKEEKESILIERFYNVIEKLSKFHSSYDPNYDVKIFVDELKYYNLSNIDLNDIVNGLFIEDSKGDIVYDNKSYRERFEDDPLFISTRQKLIDNVVEITDAFERKVYKKFLGELRDKIIITYYSA